MAAIDFGGPRGRDMLSGWAPPSDNFSPSSILVNRKDYAGVGFESDMSTSNHATTNRTLGHELDVSILDRAEEDTMDSNFAGTNITDSRSSVSSRRGFRRPVAPKFSLSEGPLQEEEAVAMFKRIDLNMDGHITHAELMRAIQIMPEMARRLERTGKLDVVPKTLVRKVLSGEVILPENDSFSLYEWVNLICGPLAEREFKAEQFVKRYRLDEQSDRGFIDKAQNLAKLHSARIGDTSSLKPAAAVLVRAASIQSKAEESLRRRPTSTSFGEIHDVVKSTSFGEEYDTTRALVHSNHELTRQLQA